MRRQRLRVGVLAICAALLPAACSSSGGGSSASVFTVEPGQCFVAPKTPHTELSSIDRVPCTKPHTEEAYAKVKYRAGGTAPSAAAGGAYPGGDALDKFAKGACAQRFTKYVGVDYLDSKLFFTYLMPSARSWEQDGDRIILCFVTATGGNLTASVKGSRR